MGEASRLFGLAINATADQRVATLPNAQGQQRLCLRLLMLA
jgi:hypothetical protein